MCLAESPAGHVRYGSGILREFGGKGDTEDKVGTGEEKKTMGIQEGESDEATWKLIGWNLCHLRNRVNMPLFQFAEYLGIPEDEYARLEEGIPNLELLQLSRYYGLPLRWFHERRLRC
jgi:hypothetical protein